MKRELLEESALAINQFEFSNIAIAIGKYDDRSVLYEFHHTGFHYGNFLAEIQKAVLNSLQSSKELQLETAYYRLEDLFDEYNPF